MTRTEGPHDMGDGVQPDGDGFLHNQEVAHEHSDVNIRALLTFAVGLAVVTVIAAVATWGLFLVFEHQAAQGDTQVTPLAAPPSNPTFLTGVKGADPAELQNFPQPRLLVNEPTVLQRHREAEAQALGNYGWVDQKAGVARMPIGEAKKLILQRGIPARPDAPPDARLGTHAAAMGEASGGRNLSRASQARPAQAAPQGQPDRKEPPAAAQPPKGQ